MKILVAEDNQKLANLIKTGLQQENYAVDVFYTGDEALTYATSPEYDLLVLDRMLPGATGMQICTEVRAQNITTPILFLTAKDAIEDRVEGLDAGADDYLVKPFAFDELLARIRTLLRRQQPTKSPTLTYDSLSLDPAKKLVTRCGEEIVLTAREYALLEYLLRNKEHTVSSSQIIDHVWDQDYDGFSNIVQTYIKQLRQKIDKAFKQEKPLIKTIRGLGYVLKG